MSLKGNKFGAFKGVFTPSILTILGVIMYLRLPWIVGEAGLLATIGIILVAHLISVTTGLSVASIATNKRVETGGTYFMISRSLGLPIGGTLGLALFVGLSFSVSLYLIGFSETFLTALGLEPSLYNIRITGTLTLLAVTILTFLSTSLALKTQFIILAVMALSLVSIFFGRHEFAPSEPLIESATRTLPWIALFAVFFPAVTGFEAGVSMSGDLRDPKSSIPKGTISAIFVGLIVYLGLAFFFSYTVNGELLKDSTVLYQISLFSPLVIAGVWGATLSSALGSILGAPRILQATAIDRITPKFFAKGFGAGNEPRNALYLTFLIAFGGIMIGDLNVIARIVTIFFIITYGFLNLTCAIENIAGSDFRPSFKVPAWVGFLGAFASFIVMIQLDVIAMLGATVILGALFLILKRRELTLQSGDTWGGIWSSLVKMGLYKLSDQKAIEKHNWRPNIILFSGSASSRPYLISLARSVVGRLGVFTNFELVEEKSDQKHVTKSGATIATIDSEGKKVFTRQLICKDIYEGMNTISSVYGFTGFEPNTILLGWGKTTNEPEKFIDLIEHFSRTDYSLALLGFDKEKGFGNKKRIDLWWNEGSNNLYFGITLLKFLTSDSQWRRAKLRVLLISHDSSISEKAHYIIRQILDDNRIDGNIKIIENNIEKKPYDEIIHFHSVEADLTILDFGLGGDEPDMKSFNNLNKIIKASGTSLIIKAGNEFDSLSIPVIKGMISANGPIQTKELTVPLPELLPYPNKEILANELYVVAESFEEMHRQYVLRPLAEVDAAFKNALKSLADLNEWAMSSMEKVLKQEDPLTRSKSFSKLYGDYLFKADRLIISLEKELLPAIRNHFTTATADYLSHATKRLEKVPEKISVSYNRAEFKINKSDLFLTRLRKFRLLAISRLSNQKVTHKTQLRRIESLFLVSKRKETNYEIIRELGIASFLFLSSLRQNLTETNQIIQNINNHTNDIVSASLAMQEAKDKQTELLRQIGDQTGNAISSLSQHISSELQLSLENISIMLGDPLSVKGIRAQEKDLDKWIATNSFSAESHEVLEKNLLFYVNKIHTEFILHSLKARLKAKLSKYFVDLEIMLENKLGKPLQGIKDIISDFQHEFNENQAKEFFDVLKDQEPINLHLFFELFFRDLQLMIAELPSEIIITHPDFISRIEKRNFDEHEGELVELRKQTNLYIGRDMINKLRIELGNTESSLAEIHGNISDIFRLAIFNIENVEKNSHGEISSIENKRINDLNAELLERIDQQQTKVNQTYWQTIANINALADSSFEPLANQLLTHEGKVIKSPVQKSRSEAKISELMLKFRRSFQKHWVNILYTQSEGLLFFKKISKTEPDHKFVNQVVHEIIDTLVPNPEVAREIPYYYANLFAGNSTVNKELWVGMNKQRNEAKSAVGRFRKGYGGAILITGERNSGKSSLSRFIAREVSVDNRVYVIRAPKAGSAKLEDLHTAILSAININMELDYLLDIQQRDMIFVFNDLELWWQRTTDGLEAIEELFRIIEKFGKKHLFIVNCRNWTYYFLNRFYGLEKYFLAHIECEPFDARELKEMIMIRHKAGGLIFKINKKEESNYSQYDYAQLFNRYFTLSDGNPGYAIRAWINNITGINGKTIELRKPVVPDSSSLANLSHEMMLVVLQFVLHRRFTPAKLADVLHKTEQYASMMIGDMHRVGLLEEKFPGVFALNIVLEPFLVEELKQKKLL
ncbi:MAG: amino acid permease [Bacteroidales bacterium]|nr:amino acid permease [Bacteroidales bacterium]